jgi:hypothetical protein
MTRCLRRDSVKSERAETLAHPQSSSSCKAGSTWDSRCKASTWDSRQILLHLVRHTAGIAVPELLPHALTVASRLRSCLVTMQGQSLLAAPHCVRERLLNAVKPSDKTVDPSHTQEAAD